MPRFKFQNPRYLLEKQYKTDAHLQNRIHLHDRFSTNPYGLQRWMFDHFTLPPDSRILELGCGPGTLWQKNLDRLPESWNLTLTDFSPGMVAAARQTLASRPGPATWESADAQALPYERASFDAVMAHFMLYHVPDRPKAFAEIARVLEPGGAFFATTLGKNHLREIHSLVIAFDPALQFGLVENPFSLENGAAQLAPFFTVIQLHRYEDSLLITEPGPLITYILSTALNVETRLPEERRRALSAFVHAHIAENGPLHVTKEVGMFTSTPLT